MPGQEDLERVMERVTGRIKVECCFNHVRLENKPCSYGSELEINMRMKAYCTLSTQTLNVFQEIF